MNSEQLKSFLTEAKVKEEYHAAIYQANEAVEANAKAKKMINDFVNQYKNNLYFDYIASLCQINTLLRNLDLTSYQLKMIYIISLMIPLKKHYQSFGYSLEMYDQLIEDVAYKIEECFLVYHEAGIFVATWYVDFFKLHIFAFGRLQYQFAFAPYPYKGEDGEVKKGQKVISIHIPRSGKKLSPEAVDSSLKEAEAFFLEMFPDQPLVFMCDSWILFPPTIRLLDEKSNMALFAKRFSLAFIDNANLTADLWRLFDTLYDGDYSHLPADTTLRKKMINHLQNGGIFSRATGYIIVKK